ncbi:hypothetical protein T01_1047 [Trichinella spiralis]|uniref:Uncharacterized protein n=1 Tax=Trichinella spiralis TaxID=6334 RepID=A0A0V1BPC7_TRISP|nr:hypothetical protein T01_1047 [Trichinella spiralis]
MRKVSAKVSRRGFICTCAVELFLRVHVSVKICIGNILPLVEITCNMIRPHILTVKYFHVVR